MAKRVRRLGALVLSIDDPSPERYAEVFRQRFNRHKRADIAIRLSYGTEGLIEFISRETRSDRGRPFIEGRIAKFQYIEPNTRWFDAITREEIPDEVGKQYLPPEGKKHHYQTLTFRFYINEHTIVSELKNSYGTISIGQLEKLFEGVLNPEGTDETITISSLKDKNAVEAIIQTPNLRKLTVTYVKPNPASTKQQHVRRVMEETRTKQISTTYTAASPAEGINAQAIRADLEATIEYGYIEANGVNESGVAVTKTTKSSPLQKPYEYDSDDGSHETLGDHMDDFIRTSRRPDDNND
ncbi:MAG TPA: DUF4747 family protein [Chlorobiota bacterium]|nr:DUF4747 family protein [Chlorobiota bacterium]